METQLQQYFDRMELMAFFSGYITIFLLLNSLTGMFGEKMNRLIQKGYDLLPYAYALTGLLYLGLFIKNLTLDHSPETLGSLVIFPFLKLYALLSLFFWWPRISKKPLLSLLHSLAFFGFLVYDFILYIQSDHTYDAIKNDMRLFTDSTILNASTLIIVIALYYGYQWFGAKKDSK